MIKRFTQNRMLIFGIVILIISLLCYYFYPFQTGYTPMSEIKQNPYTQNLTPRCAGRFLIDLPADFQYGVYGNGPSHSEINQHEVTAQPMTEKEFNTQLWMREDELKDDTKHVFYTPEDKPYLKETYPLKDGRKGVIFNHNEGVGNIGVLRELEGHLFSNNVGIILTVNAKDADSSRYDKDKKQYPTVYSTNLPQKLDEIQDLLSRMEGWDNIHIPQGKGTCYPNIFIKGPAGDYEYVTNQYFYKGNQQVQLAIDYDTDLHSKDTMLQRMGEIKSLVSDLPEGKIIRSGKRSINGLQAEEILASNKNEKTGNIFYMFTLKANEMNGTPQTPAITITLKNDGVIPEKDIIAIWDAIIPTLKPRVEAY